MNKNILLLLFCFISFGLHAESYKIQSPDNKLEVSINVGQNTTFSIVKEGFHIIKPSSISLKLGNGTVLGCDSKITKAKTARINQTLNPVIHLKSKTIDDKYNELVLTYRENYQLICRVYDEGFSYRWATNFNDEILVLDEKASFVFAANHEIFFPEEESVFSAQERLYAHTQLSEITPNRFCSTPTLISLSNGAKVWISEADLLDYPGMFLQGLKGEYGLEAKFAGYPKRVKIMNDRDAPVRETYNYIAKTNGTRQFPWRICLIADNDCQLAESQIVFKLSSECKIKDTDWIKPGKVAWDWWNDWNITGVDFKAGCNTQTYKYYIDFASENNLEYIIIDEGWYHLDNVLKLKNEVDIQEIVRYGATKNVGVILWVTWLKLDENLNEILSKFNQWGIKGIKVDFMMRDDQWMVNFYQGVAEKAAEEKLLVDFHGAYKPTGLHRSYPNVVSFEGVYANEQNKYGQGNTPTHQLILPFVRNVAGPMDYTPGAMINSHVKEFRNMPSLPMSMGTRCNELAKYVVYESPLQMLCDNPTHYKKEPECMQFLKQVPTVWDNTKVLDGKVAEYIVTMREKDDVFFIGAMTNETSRELNVSLSFLPEGTYQCTSWMDGVNADRNAMDFSVKKQIITDREELKLSMAKSGGYCCIIQKIKQL